MCGIFAVFGLKEPASELRKEALRLSKLLRHRGPDWSGIHCCQNCILTHERLAINGLHCGAQPILNKSRDISLSVNGEIYNYLELKEQLINLDPKILDDFTTDSDCEVLLHLYKKHGKDFLKTQYVNGMFAFALYDETEDEYIVARDPIGIIPLYIGWGPDGSIWFASELKALQDHCDHFEAFPPGHVYVGRSVRSAKSNTMEQFYNERWFIDQDYIPKNTFDIMEFRTQLTDSVRRHMLSDVPYGVLLSGGLDSSLIASIACREYKKIGNADFIRSFCIGLIGSPDIAAAEKVAKHIGSRHYSYTFTIQEGVDVLNDVISHVETFDITTIRASTPMFLLARRIKATGCKMVLSGEGADEIFAGYLYFHKAPNAEELHKECVRKVRDLYKFDCLRANKSSMAWGVEARVPFLDREFLEYAMNLDPELKTCKGRGEKHILRQAFDDPENPYLPEEVLWRQKEQFSDGVGYGWIDSLKEIGESYVSDLQMKFAENRFPVNPPKTKEAYMYREIFSKLFPNPSGVKTVPSGKSIACSTPAAIAWDPSFQNAADPSGRAIMAIHNASSK